MVWSSIKLLTLITQTLYTKTEETYPGVCLYFLRAHSSAINQDTNLVKYYWIVEKDQNVTYTKFQITTSGTPAINAMMSMRFSNSNRTTWTRFCISLGAVLRRDPWDRIASWSLMSVQLSSSSSKVSRSSPGKRDWKIVDDFLGCDSSSVGSWVSPSSSSAVRLVRRLFKSVVKFVVGCLDFLVDFLATVELLLFPERVEGILEWKWWKSDWVGWLWFGLMVKPKGDIWYCSFLPDLIENHVALHSKYRHNISKHCLISN